MFNRPHTTESKRKISKKLKKIGHKPPLSKYWLGKKLSKKTRKKMSLSLKGRRAWNKGLKNIYSKEAIEKMRTFKTGKVGKESTGWRGGRMEKYSDNERIRKSIEFRLWRESVFARDNWTCQKYGIKGGKLNPHHINNFADYPELRTSIENGITLSEKAHKEFHKKYGKKIIQKKK